MRFPIFLQVLFSSLVLAGCGEQQAGMDWSAAEWQQIEALSIASLPATPVDASNRYVRDPHAVELGSQLFFDPRLSRNGQVSCASCHQPDRQFSDGQPQATALGTGRRNTPSLLGVAYNHWFFWDGRKDSLWSQALAPLEDPLEQGSSRTDLVRLVLTDPDYRQKYRAVFGDQGLPDVHKLPVDAKPSGTIEQIRAWKNMDNAQREAIDQSFAHLGKAIAAYVTTLKPVTTRFDRYVSAVNRGDTAKAAVALDQTELQGLRLFISQKAQCSSCHSGALLTNQTFQNIGTGELGADSGRAAVVDEVRFDRFNCLGAFSDAAAASCQDLKYMQRSRHPLLGAFKTPSLRNVGKTAPYFHDGRLPTLESVLDYYASAMGNLSGETHLPNIQLNEQDKLQLLAFLKTLNAEDSLP